VHELAAPGAVRPRGVEGLTDDGLVVIGVHRPEFSFEHELSIDALDRSTVLREQNGDGSFAPMTSGRTCIHLTTGRSVARVAHPQSAESAHGETVPNSR
jgi:hypothetical protein